jgi:hypothetical protein
VFQVQPTCLQTTYHADKVLKILPKGGQKRRPSGGPRGRNLARREPRLVASKSTVCSKSGSHLIGVERVENVIRRVCCVRAAVFRQRKSVGVRVTVADEVFQVAGVIREHGVSPVGVAGRGLGRCRVDVVVVTGTEVWKGGLGCMRSNGAAHL